MPTIHLKNAIYHYIDEGNGEKIVVFGHGLLWSNWMFHNQISFLKTKFRIIAFDFRGQGKSVSLDGKYDMESLHSDVEELIEKITDRPVIYAGLSMGGYIGMTLAAKRPDLIDKLVLMDSSCEPETTESKMKYKMLNNLVRTVGYWPVEKNIMGIMFGKKFLEDNTRKKEYEFFLNKLKENNRSTIIKATEGVINRESLEPNLQNINCQTLVIVGSQDVPCPVNQSEYLVSKIKNASLVIIDGAGHTGTLEEPEKYNLAIESFIEND